MTTHRPTVFSNTVHLQLCFVQWLLKVDRSSTQSACTSQPVLFQPVSTPGSPWSSAGDSGTGQSPQASCSFATTVTYCKPDAAVSSVSTSSTLEVSDSLTAGLC